MPSHYTCPSGHRWETVETPTLAIAGALIFCPTCGNASGAAATRQLGAKSTPIAERKARRTGMGFAAALLTGVALLGGAWYFFLEQHASANDLAQRRQETEQAVLPAPATTGLLSDQEKAFAPIPLKDNAAKDDSGGKAGGGDDKRGQPKVLLPAKAVYAVALPQIKTYVFDKDSKGNLSRILVVKDRGDLTKDLAFEWIPVAKLKDQARVEVFHPLRQVEIDFAFPLRQQIEEFQRKLHLANFSGVVADHSGELDEEKQPLPAFRFLGVNLQRQTLDSASGKLIVDWETIDLNKTFKEYLLLNGKRFENEQPELDSILIPGMLMPRLLASTAAQYPRPELQLEKIKKMVDSNKSKKKDNGNPFKPDGGLDGPQGKDAEPPEYGLGRVIDVTVEPNRTYRYKLQIKMANPNKDRKNVQSPEFAQEPFLLSDWYEIKQDVVVPPETFFYAVDQKVLEKDYRGQNRDYSIQKDRQVMVQLHKWVYSLPMPTDIESKVEKKVEIGEWVVAERVPVARGEYVVGNQRVQVPVWKASKERFVLMTDKYSGKYPGVSVDFSQADDTDLVLVDFTGGQVKYDRGGKATISDQASTEVLVLSPDGRLLVHDSANDVKDPQRVERVRAYRERIKEVKGDKAELPDPFKGGGPNN
jgi:hypothetical protein